MSFITYRDARSGRYVTAEFAAEYPAETVSTLEGTEAEQELTEAANNYNGCISAMAERGWPTDTPIEQLIRSGKLVYMQTP